MVNYKLLFGDNSHDTNSRERPKPTAHLREKKYLFIITYRISPSAYDGPVGGFNDNNILINPHNVTNVIIEKSLQSDAFSNPPLKLVAPNSNNVLSSFRNGPVKAGLSTGAKATKLPVEKPRNVTPLSRDPSAPAKIAPPKKTRPGTAQHARPASPGIHGKVADAPYKTYTNTIKGKKQGENPNRIHDN